MVLAFTAILALKPAAEMAWNRPVVLVLRSQVKLATGHTEEAFSLARQAALAQRKCPETSSVPRVL